VVFVIDCHDKQRITVAKEELIKLSKKIDRSSSIPFIIAANKQDLSSLLKMIFIIYYFIILYFLESLNKEDLILALSLPEIQSKKWKKLKKSANTGKLFSKKKRTKNIQLFL